eukprot:1084486-Amphidinium_carterae.1
MTGKWCSTGALREAIDSRERDALVASTTEATLQCQASVTWRRTMSERLDQADRIPMMQVVNFESFVAVSIAHGYTREVETILIDKGQRIRSHTDSRIGVLRRGVGCHE